MKADAQNPYRLLPSVEEVLLGEELSALGARVPRELLTCFVAELLDVWRAEIKAGRLDAEGLEKRLGAGALVANLVERMDRERKAGLVQVVNAAGVVLHTGLGRAPVHPEAAEAMAQAAQRYGTLEVERFSGQRNKRDDRLSVLLERLTGAEAAIAVNNNAAAVVLLLSTFALGKETVVSRGELVEIGGSFRMPNVMQQAGTKLVEVGTTNRTRVADFRAGVNERTGLLLKVHTSNYKVVGFTEEVDVQELADLGRELGVTAAFDLGAGMIEAEGTSHRPELSGEPFVRAAVKTGIDAVSFSGDKLLGGPQAGLIVGTQKAIDALRANPLYRALRLDKVTIAGLEKTLGLYLEGRGNEIPALAMLAKSAEELRPVAVEIAAFITSLPGFEARVEEGASQPGSGSAPDVFLPSVVVAVSHSSVGLEQLAAGLRAADPVVFTRIQEGRLLLDPRTLLAGDKERLLEAFEGLAIKLK